MGVEIERKFKVEPAFRPTGVGTEIAQGYLSRDPKRTVRIRMAGSQGFFTVKGETHGIARAEYEYGIPPDEARALLLLCLPSPVEKTRYVEMFAGHRWEVDVFHGANEGLRIAEVELTFATEEIVLPDWAGAEVTGQERYYNAALSAHPYTAWTEEERTGYTHGAVEKPGALSHKI